MSIVVSSNLLARFCCALFCIFVFTFVICELGQRFSIKFEKINIHSKQLKWYLFPCNTQKMVLIISIITQNPIELDIFGSISCNRITFKMVSQQTKQFRMQIKTISRCQTISYLGLPQSVFELHDT